ncbi:MAG: 30S ribosomal protein S20 [Endomicrobium sp.]|jgi:small subunit ribosomal protein S20|nr:30S ribosomal protein S20 [Endomicrobium sp.]
MKLKTGRHTSAIKETRKSKKRNKINMIIKNRIKTLIKKIKEYVKDNNDNNKVGLEKLSDIFSKLDRASKKNVLHNNTVSKQKAKLAKLFYNRK